MTVNQEKQYTSKQGQPLTVCFYVGFLMVRAGVPVHSMQNPSFVSGRGTKVVLDECCLHTSIDSRTSLLVVLPMVLSGSWRYSVPTVLEPSGGTPVCDFPLMEGVLRPCFPRKL